MGNWMADHFLSSMVFIFKVLLLKTLKFKLCRSFSLKRVDEFSWDKMQIIHNLFSYGSKSCNLEVFMFKYFFHDKNPDNSKKWKILYKKKISFWYEKILTHQNLKITNLRSITT